MISEEELKKVIKLYPGLKYIQKEGKRLLKGSFEFCALYDAIEDKFILNPSIGDVIDDRVIRDSYEIDVEFISKPQNLFPEVRETGGRIQKIRANFNITDIRELHVNENQNNTICLCPKPELFLRYPNGLEIVDFFNALILPYFYGLSYFEKHKEWPRGSYGHGDVGIFEFYYDYRDKMDINLIIKCVESLSERKSMEYLQSKGKIKGHRECICGSKLKIKKCHIKALEGLRFLKEDIKRLSVNPLKKA